MSAQRNCHMCLACDDAVEASVFCRQCKQYFCAECENEHTVTPVSEDHTFVSVAEGVLLEIPLNCGICQKLNKTTKALTRCRECKLLLCGRCGRKHSANRKTSFHTQDEDLSVHTEEEVNRYCINTSNIIATIRKETLIVRVFL